MNTSISNSDPTSTAERKLRTTHRPPMPDAHADVALGDIHDVCALVRMSPSWVHDAVAKNEFPAPIIRRPRCTRWQIAHVRSWLLKLASDPAQVGDVTRATAKKASDAAQAKRVAAIAG